MRLPALISGPGMSIYGPIMDLVCCKHTALYSSASLLFLLRPEGNAPAVSLHHIMLEVYVVCPHAMCTDGHTGLPKPTLQLLIGCSTAGALLCDGIVCFGIVI